MSTNIDLSKTQQYLDWLKDKLYLNSQANVAAKRKVYHGQVYLCKLGIGIGSEECKERPCVILQNNSANATSPNTIVAPITHSSATLSTVVPISPILNNQNRTILDGNVLLGNITCVSKARLGDYIATLHRNEIKKINKAILLSLNLNREFQTLQNKYDDKMKYISKLKEGIAKQTDNINAINAVMNHYNIKDLDELDSLLKVVYSTQD